MFKQMRQIRRELTSISRVNYNLLRLKKMQWMRQPDLEKVQMKRLRRIIKYAYDHVPYYHELLKSVRVKPDNIMCLQDLQKIPITTKEDVQKNYSKIIPKAIDLSNCAMVTTTGSTGKPMKVFYNDTTDNNSCALWQYVFFECGLYFTNTLADINSSIDISYRPPRFSIRRTSARAYMKKADLSLYNPVNKNIEILERIQPDAIYTFPSILTLLAEHLREKNDSKIRAKLIFTIGETVTQYCRKTVREAFGVDINDIYGSAEFERMAFECNEHAGLHILPDCVLEFLSEGEAVESGEEGKIIATGLYNYVMPLIRYRIGDVGIPINDHCCCGRSFPLVKKILGRTDDFIVLPSGTVISPRSINVIETVHGILHYQTIQCTKDRFLVKVVTTEGFGQNSINQIEEIIKKGCFGEDIKVDVKIVDELPRERTGKLRAVISNVKQP